MTEYGDIFISVRQRVAAFKLWREFNAKNSFSSQESEEEYLDQAYRFLNTSIDMEFIKYCADKEGYSLEDYLKYGLNPLYKKH